MRECSPPSTFHMSHVTMFFVVVVFFGFFGQSGEAILVQGLLSPGPTASIFSSSYGPNVSLAMVMAPPCSIRGYLHLTNGQEQNMSALVTQPKNCVRQYST